MPPNLGISEVVEEEPLHQDERDGYPSGIRVDAVDVRDAEEDVATARQQKTEQKRTSQMVVVVGGGEVPEDAVWTRAAQHNHKDSRVTQHGECPKRIAPCRDVVCGENAKQIPDWVDDV